MSSEIESVIRNKVEAGLDRLSPRLRQWAEQHLVRPCRITARTLVDHPQSETEAWWVTDHVGERDSGYRAVYDKDFDKFGLITTVKDGPELYLGLYGTVNGTIEGM